MKLYALNIEIFTVSPGPMFVCLLAWASSNIQVQFHTLLVIGLTFDLEYLCKSGDNTRNRTYNSFQFVLFPVGTESERTDTEELVGRAASQCSAPPDLLPSEARALLQPATPPPPRQHDQPAAEDKQPRMRFEVTIRAP